MCCEMDCCLKLVLLRRPGGRDRLLATAEHIQYLRSLEPPDVGNRVHQAYVLSTWSMCCTMEKQGQMGKYRLPLYNAYVCGVAWRLVMQVSERTLLNWRMQMGAEGRGRPQRLLRRPHGLTEQKNAINEESNEAVKAFVRRVAKEEGFTMPTALRRDKDKNAAGTPVYTLPPAYTIPSLFKKYTLETEEAMTVSERQFRLLFEELDDVRLSGKARGLCDFCMEKKDRLRGVPEGALTDEISVWYRHIQNADAARDLYHKAKETRAPDTGMISFDFARQLDVPDKLRLGTMLSYFAELKAYDVNIFGIVNEHEKAHGVQYNLIYGEGGKHGSHAVVSLLHYFLTSVQPETGNKKVLYVQSDSCQGQNKNNIVLDYFLWRVVRGYHDRVIWRFMEVGHTKNRADQGFGHIRSAIGHRGVYGLPGLAKLITTANSVGTSEARVVPDDAFRDWTPLTEKFQTYEGIRRDGFVYEFEIESVIDAVGARVAKVAPRMGPTGGLEDSRRLLKQDAVLGDALTESLPAPPRPLSKARLLSLRDEVWDKIRTRPDMDPDDRSWWISLLAPLNAAPVAAPREAGAGGPVEPGVADGPRAARVEEEEEPAAAAAAAAAAASVAEEHVEDEALRNPLPSQPSSRKKVRRSFEAVLQSRFEREAAQISEKRRAHPPRHLEDEEEE